MTTKDLADNAAIQLLARASMMFAAPAFAIIGWLLVRSVQTVDMIQTRLEDVSQRVNETGSNVRMMQQAQGAQTLILGDHETRMRALERLSRPPQ